MVYKYKVYYNSCFCLSGNPAFDALNGMGFQYNSCFYLSSSKTHAQIHRWNFNTTLVFIYPGASSFLFFPSLISIQLLFLFIISMDKAVHTTQYYFNTTLVFVYPYYDKQLGFFKDHFNTTLVFVYQDQSDQGRSRKWYFNTTLVFVYLHNTTCQRTVLLISIQLLFLFIENDFEFNGIKNYISIQLLFLFI